MKAPAPSVSPAPQSFLAFDLGTKRTGVAYASRLLGTAQGQSTVKGQGDVFWQAVTARIREWQPDALVVGVPFHPDGAEHEMTLRARRFARQLHGRYGLPVFEVDERYSTTEALLEGAADADAGAACIILDQFLRGLSE
jgi:putative holliday junction resolvase